MSYKITRLRSNGEKETIRIAVIRNGCTPYKDTLKEHETYDIILQDELKIWKIGHRLRLNVLEKSTSNTRVELTQEWVKANDVIKWSNILVYKGKMVEWFVVK